MTPTFVVNFGTTGRIGYLKTDVTLRVSAQAVAAVERHMPALRHELIMLLSGQSAEALAGSGAARGAAARGTASRAQGDRGGRRQRRPAQTGVQDLLFTSFILQR